MAVNRHGKEAQTKAEGTGRERDGNGRDSKERTQ
jgi:hypothetical protein